MEERLLDAWDTPVTLETFFDCTRGGDTVFFFVAFFAESLEGLAFCETSFLIANFLVAAVFAPVFLVPLVLVFFMLAFAVFLVDLEDGFLTDFLGLGFAAFLRTDFFWAMYDPFNNESTDC